MRVELGIISSKKVVKKLYKYKLNLMPIMINLTKKKRITNHSNSFNWKTILTLIMKGILKILQIIWNQMDFMLKTLKLMRKDKPWNLWKSKQLFKRNLKMLTILILKMFQNNQNHWKLTINQIGSFKLKHNLVMKLTLMICQRMQELITTWTILSHQPRLICNWNINLIMKEIQMIFQMIHSLIPTWIMFHHHHLLSFKWNWDLMLTLTLVSDSTTKMIMMIFLKDKIQLVSFN